MIRIRLRRVGAKKQPSYRVVVADSRSPRDGRFIEKIGFYNPRTEPATMVINEGRALYWLSQGAQPSDPVRHILNKTGTWSRYERLRTGETIDTLLAEADAALKVQAPQDARTRRDDLLDVRAAQARARARARAEAQAVTAVGAVEAVAETGVATTEEPIAEVDEVASEVEEIVAETQEDTDGPVEAEAPSEEDEEAGGEESS
jgi:small subunit ribosomal protein S16